MLATYGLSERGKMYVHVKVFKQDRIYGEILITEGKVQLHCRECLRWHTVTIAAPGRAELAEDKDPPTITSGGA